MECDFLEVPGKEATYNGTESEYDSDFEFRVNWITEI